MDKSLTRSAPSLHKKRILIPQGATMATASLSKTFTECSAYLRGVLDLSPDTLSNYERSWHQFLHSMQSKGKTDEVAHFTVDAVMDWCSEMGSMGIHPNTILNKIAGLSRLAKYLMMRRDGRNRPLLTENPCVGFEKPQPVYQETKFLHLDELAKIMEVPCVEGLVLARALIFDTGIRRQECADAKAGDLRQYGEDWVLTIPVKGRRRKGAEPARVPVSADVATKLVNALKAREANDTDPLIVTRSGKAYTRAQLTQAMIRLGKRAGITRVSTSPHKFRHTANVLARMGKVDPVVRAEMLNHRGQRTLARYDHLVPGETAKGRAAQRQVFEDYLQGVRGKTLTPDQKRDVEAEIARLKKLLDTDCGA